MVQNNKLDENGLRLPWLTIFLGTTFVDILLKPSARIGIILLYITGLAIAILGCTQLQKGTDPIDLIAADSYSHDYLMRLRRDFDEITSPMVMFGLAEPLDYTDPAIRHEISRLIRKLQSTDYFFREDHYIISWLWDFEIYLTSTNRNIDDQTMPRFIQILQNEFFKIPKYEKYLVDVDINYSNTSIQNSRFLLKSKRVIGIREEVDLMNFVRERARRSPFDMKVFSNVFIIGDQHNSLLSTTLLNLGIALGCILVVSLIFIPNVTTAIWITLATLSICVYTIGFMAHWNVNLDSVSMINLIQSMGFSVDFTAHISYHFVINQSNGPTQAARTALGHLGTPIIQGALSTILSMAVLATSETYIFRTFFKCIFMVMIFCFFHAMFLLPVLLSTIRSRWTCGERKETDQSESKTESRDYIRTSSDSNLVLVETYVNGKRLFHPNSKMNDLNEFKTMRYDFFSSNGLFRFDNRK